MGQKGNRTIMHFIESICKTLKRKPVHDAYLASIEQAQLELFKYMEICYNPKGLFAKYDLNNFNYIDC